MHTTKITFFAILFSVASCQPIAVREFTSGIDQKFQLKRLESSTGSLSEFTLDLYSSSLTNVVGNPCQMFPSDSHQARILQKKCGTSVAIFREVDRLYAEPGAIELGHPTMYGPNGFLYVDLPENCSLY